MPLLTDLATVHALLERDRTWAAYAIGDLAPGFVEQCEWRATDGTEALLLLYRGFDPPIVFAMGRIRDARTLFGEVTAPEISLHVQPEALDALAGIYAPKYTRRMLRMAVGGDSARLAPHDDVSALTDNDLTAINDLYRDGHTRGEGPAFFSPAMLRQGTFCGIWENGTLVSIAGTHLYSAELGVCAIGNVYTRGDRRGRGLAARVTSAVVAQALRDCIPTIVLNVSLQNVAAQRVYERLGFARYCEFLEGEATRVAGTP